MAFQFDLFFNCFCGYLMAIKKKVFELYLGWIAIDLRGQMS